MKKKILIIAYFFPPYGSVGAFRVSKLVKYFKNFGWDITVITVDEKYYSSKELDYNKVNDIPDDIQVIKTSRLHQFSKFKEEGLYWSKDLYFTIKKLIKFKEFDYMFYTGGPFMQFSIAPKIKKISNIPYILDFRDPWLLTPYNNSNLRKKVAGILEPYAIRNAELVLNVTDDATNLYRKYYPMEDKNKFITIPNGYDKDDFKDIEDINIEKGNLKIVYSGKFGGFRNPIPFLNSIINYNNKNKKKITFIHIGSKEQEIEDFIQSNPCISKYMIQVGFVPYKVALAYIKASDIGLIISGGHPYEPTTKIYDYIALNKKILCINNIEYGYLYETLKEYSNSTQCKNLENEINMCLNSIKGIDEATSDINNELFDREVIFRKLDNMLLNKGE